jgi:hypothetical protein
LEWGRWKKIRRIEQKSPLCGIAEITGMDSEQIMETGKDRKKDAGPVDKRSFQFIPFLAGPMSSR